MFHGLQILYGTPAWRDCSAWNWLVGCSTMSDYCERLRIHGAVYYKDVRESIEARDMGLVMPTSQLTNI
jgi:hypothetical protein